MTEPGTALAAKPASAAGAAVEAALINGDLKDLNPAQRLQHYMNVCNSLGLNPHTKPFGYISLNGKLTLYALRECTEQLRKINGVSIQSLQGQLMADVYVVTAMACDKTGRTDTSTGAVPMAGLAGEAKANALMKAETKAKRRVTLSICGLGMLDESEAPSIQGAKVMDVEQAHNSVNLEGQAPEGQDQAPAASAAPTATATASEPIGEWVIAFKLSPEQKQAAARMGWKKQNKESRTNPGKFYDWVFVPASWSPPQLETPPAGAPPATPEPLQPAPGEGVDNVTLGASLMKSTTMAELYAKWQLVLDVQGDIPADKMVQLMKIKREKENELSKGVA